MFCPNCGEKNLDDINFCRICRANLSLVPQALTGQLPKGSTGKPGKNRDHKKPPTIECGIKQTFMGIGFIFISLCVLGFAPAGRIWWFWMLIPAFTYLGKGVSEIFAAKQAQQNLPQANQFVNRQAIPPPPAHVDFRPRDTGEMVQPPPSVTESTTKLFDPPAN
jgi:hypothetical protein